MRRDLQTFCSVTDSKICIGFLFCFVDVADKREKGDTSGAEVCACCLILPIALLLSLLSTVQAHP